MMRVDRRTIRVDGRVIHYEVIGENGPDGALRSGEPLVLVHGLSASTLWWRRNIAALAQHYRVYLVDLPGFGAMRRFYYRFVLDNMADWLLAWMEAMGMSRAVLIGHSMGGYICLHVAARRPELVRKLVLVAPAGMPYKKTMVGFAVPLLFAVYYARPAFLPILLYDALRTGPLTFVSATRDLLRKDLRGQLRAVTTPTLIIWGERDALVPSSFSAIFQQEMSDVRLLLLKRAGHVAMYDQPREFNAAVLAFLAETHVGEA